MNSTSFNGAKLTSAFRTNFFLVLVYIFMFFLILISQNSCRQKKAIDLPGTFSFNGERINPTAVYALYKAKEKMLDLSSFKSAALYEDWDIQPGWLISYYEENIATGRRPFFAYAAFTNLDPNSADSAGKTELYVLSIAFDDGSAGEVNNLLLVEKQGPWLFLHRTWKEGLSCNGAITNQRIEGDNFFYSRELTPVDLLELSSEPLPDLMPNEDLEAGIESCIGLANYVFNFLEDRETLISVSLYEEPRQDEPGKISSYRYQSCFNKIFNAYINEGKTLLRPQDIKEFVGQFKSACMEVK